MSLGADVGDVLAVVVSYNPGPELADLCRQLHTEHCATVIVDNASSHGQEHLDAAYEAGAEVVRLDANLGVSGALSLALARAASSSYEWLLTFDQDSVLPPGFVATLRGSQLISPTTGAIGPVVRDRISAHPLQPDPQGTPVRFLITSGSLCRVTALSAIGGFRDDLFIDLVDYDLCLRLRAAGWGLEIEPAAVMNHSIGDGSRRAGVVRVSNHEPIRNYYKYRNYLHLLRSGVTRTDRAWSRRTGLGLVSNLAKILILEDRKGRKLREVAIGVYHGARGLSGPRDAPQKTAPRTAKRPAS